METTKRLFGLLIIALASVALFVACSDEETCLADGDCDEGQVCDAEVCRTSCTTNAECEEGETCQLSADGNQVCLEGSVNNLNNLNNVNNSNNSNNLNNVETTYFIAQVLDTTATECDGTDPGSDLIYVSLEESDGTILGFGNIVDDGTTGDNNENNLGANLDGNPPGSTEMCPDFSDSTVTALGCGGFVTLEFLDDGGNRVGGIAGQQIRVYEFGTQCATGTDTDEFDIILCTDPSNTPGSCTMNIGGGSGEIAATIP